MKTYVVTEYYEGAELGIVYAKNLATARKKASKLYAGPVSVKEYAAYNEQKKLEKEAAKHV